MVLLLNIIVPLVTIVLIYLGYKLKSGWPLAIAILFVVGYTLVQPSYMPKGTVKSLPHVEFQYVDTEIVDRGLKTKSPEEYDREREAVIERMNQSIKTQIQINNQLKESKE